MQKNKHLNLIRLRMQNGKTQEEMADMVGVSLPTYRNIENNKTKPSFDTLLKLSNAFNVQIEDLFKETSNIQSLRFRAVKKEKNIKKREEIIFFVSSWLDEFNKLINKLNEHNNYRYKLEHLENKTKDPIEMAQLVRDEFNIGEEPIHDICGLLEFRAGIKLYAREFNSDKFFGLCLKDINNNRAIIINTWDRISMERRIFSAAHELGHILLHLNTSSPDILYEDDKEEKEADMFASELLMPQDKFINEWEKADNCDFIERVIKVKQIFRVSYKVVLYRLNELIKKQDSSFNIWPIFNSYYFKKYGVKLTKTDEIFSLNENSPELQSLSGNIYFGRGIASLVKKGYSLGKLDKIECARILNKTNEEMSTLIETWKLEKIMTLK